MSSLAHKIALVTGSSRGIGRAIAERLARDGAAVAINYAEDAGAAREVVAGIEAAGGRAVALQADLADLAALRRLFADVDRQLGKLDILVNNVGIGALQPLAEIDEATFDRVFALNAKATLFACQEAAARLGGGGRIINISSSTAHFPLPGSSVYAATKAVAQTYAAVLAKELGPRGITVNCVSPGPTEPGMFEHAPESIKEGAAAASPFHRLGHPDDIAAVVAFLARADAGWITGQTILANGGATI